MPRIFRRLVWDLGKAMIARVIYSGEHLGEGTQQSTGYALLGASGLMQQAIFPPCRGDPDSLLNHIFIRLSIFPHSRLIAGTILENTYLDIRNSHCHALDSRYMRRQTSPPGKWTLVSLIIRVPAGRATETIESAVLHSFLRRSKLY